MTSPHLTPWFILSKSSLHIKEVRVTRSTDKSIWIHHAPLFTDGEAYETKQAISDSRYECFQTIREAVSKARDIARKELESLREEISRLEKAANGALPFSPYEEFKPFIHSSEFSLE